MNFIHRPNTNLEICGEYRIETTMGTKAWHNAYHDPSKLHAKQTGICVGGDFDKAKVVQACADHSERMKREAA